jgi:acetolactate synthase-1/2/3 large subunit
VTTAVSAGTQSYDQAAEALLALFLQLGSEKAFVNPGTDTFPLQEAWASRRERGLQSPEPVMCTHEFTAVSAAHGYFMVTGRPQSVFVHVDAGTLNAGGAMSNAHGARAGLVLCAGRAPYTCRGEMPGGKDVYIQWSQERFDQARIVQEYVKWHYELARVENLASVATRAFELAANEPAGPVYLTVAREVLMLPAPQVRMPDPRDLMPPTPPAPDTDAIIRAAEIMVGAQRPLLVAGRNGRNPASVPELMGLAELLGAQIADSYEYASVPGSHPLNIGPRLGEVLPHADVVLFVDAGVPYVPCEARPAADAAVIFLDRDPAHADFVMWEYPSDMRITAESTIGLRALRQGVDDLLSKELRNVAGERRERNAAEQRRWQEEVQARARARCAVHPIHPEWLAWCLRQALPPDAIILEEVITNRMWARTHLTSDEPGTLFTPGGSCLGWAINAAIGCKLGRPDRMVVSVVGDGGFTFGNPLAALWTAEKAGAPTLTVIFNNGGYKAAEAPLGDLYPAGAVARLKDGIVTKIDPRPDYAKVAGACGALGLRVTEPAELREALRRAVYEVQHGRSTVVDAILEPI